jgi:hypothetical protein
VAQQAVRLFLMMIFSDSPYTAELCTVYQALLYVSCQTQTPFLICSDPLSAIMSLSVSVPHHPVIAQVLSQLSHLQEKGCCVALCWISGCDFIPGNEAADTAAEEAPTVKFQSCYQPLVTSIHAYLHHTIYLTWKHRQQQAVKCKIYNTSMAVVFYGHMSPHTWISAVQ